MSDMPQTNVVILTTTIAPTSGWGRMSAEIIGRLQRDPNFLVSVVTVVGDRSVGVHPLVPKKITWWNLWPCVWRLRRLCRHTHVVHAFDGYPFGVLAYLVTRGRPKQRFVMSGVGTYSVAPLRWRWMGPLLRRAYRTADAVLCISSYTRDKIISRLPGLTNVRVVHLGVDPNTFYQPAPRTLSSTPRLLCVGNIKPRKGQLAVVQSLPLLLQKYPTLSVDFVGRVDFNDYRREMDDVIAQNHLEPHVRFWTDVTDDQLAALYAQTDVFVLPAIDDGDNFEGFGLVYAEAGCAGVPSVGTRVSGAVDIIQHQVTGVLIEQGTAPEIATAVEYILSVADYGAMSIQAQRLAQSFSWARTVQAYTAVYKGESVDA